LALILLATLDSYGDDSRRVIGKREITVEDGCHGRLAKLQLASPAAVPS